MARTASKSCDELTEDQLQNWKLLETFERRLRPRLKRRDLEDPVFDRKLSPSPYLCMVLLVLWTGSKPTKHQWEALQLYWMGWVTLEELTDVLKVQEKAH